jgi:GLPGLI family protein
MKRFLALTFSLIFSLTAFCQFPTFKIDYKFLVDSSLFQLDADEMDEKQKMLMTTASLLLAFQDGDKSVAQVWVNKNFVRAKTSFYSDNYEINNKVNNQNIFLYPESQQYYINTSPQDKILDLGDSIKLASELPIEFIEDQEKTIAGYKCKLALITAVEDEENQTQIQVWYTESLPPAYWGEYAYLKNIPGAALEISTSGIGIQASEVQPEADLNIFSIPEGYTEIDTPISSELFSFGEEAIEETEKYKEIYLSESLIAFLDEDLQLYGIKTNDGDTVVAAQFLDIYPFDNGISVVSNTEYRYGAVDLQGKTTIPLVYDALNYNSIDNIFIFSKNGKYGILTRDNEILIPNDYDYISFFVNDRAIVSNEKGYGVIDKHNQIVVPLKYDNITEVVGEYFIDFTHDRKCILYTIHGEKRATYEHISNAFEKDMFIVMDNDKYGYINGEGNVIIPIIYDYVSSFSDGLASVLRADSDTPVTINTKGEIVPE